MGIPWPSLSLRLETPHAFLEFLGRLYLEAKAGAIPMHWPHSQPCPSRNP